MSLGSRQHPCYQDPNPRSRLKPDTTSTIKYIKMYAGAIPTTYPYALPLVPGLYGQKGTVYEYRPVPFFEFRGSGAPPADLGTPGDVYIDLTPDAHALYCKSEEDWARWAGPAEAATEQLCHPHFVDERQSRYVNLHPEQGPEWVCRQTVVRRQQALRAAGILEDSHADSAQAGLRLASTIIGHPARGVSPATMGAESDLFASDSEGPSDAEPKLSDVDDEAFFPSKRARTLASSSISAARSANRPAATAAPRPRYWHPSPDPETRRLEEKLAALQADKELHQLRSRKRMLLVSLATAQRGFRPASELLQTLEKEYTKYHPSDAPSVMPTEPWVLPDLRTAVDHGKKELRATQIKRAEAEKQLAERVQWCDALRQNQ
ncbi:hypothetical protein B0H14DRAFT_3744686 [Mycena olivaceomarginata]|nr:hypothetical protein B0H14DRAFT_3744686 [Mycena olivaceomarginata]